MMDTIWHGYTSFVATTHTEKNSLGALVGKRPGMHFTALRTAAVAPALRLTMQCLELCYCLRLRHGVQ